MSRGGRPRKANVRRHPSGKIYYGVEKPPLDQIRNVVRWKALLAPDHGRKCAVYVICPDKYVGPVKVGIATSPSRRLFGLQTSHWVKLSIKSITWFRTEEEAYLIEQSVHNQLKASNLSGEWFDIGWESATRLVAETAELLQIPSIDSKKLA